MASIKLLSGEELVARGVTRIDASLPEKHGLKDIKPNGSWLEQKQIQSILEEKKHFIQTERIQKCEVLSYAEWRNDLKLAEVTKQSGGHWQFLGHHSKKKLYLKPEEALFLMETNSLILKHNEVTVSLQKAYSLLLGDEISLNQYRVYASLSRIGYKVFRHECKIENKESNGSVEIDRDNLPEKGMKLSNKESDIVVDCTETYIERLSEAQCNLVKNDSPSLSDGRVDSTSMEVDETTPNNKEMIEPSNIEKSDICNANKKNIVSTVDTTCSEVKTVGNIEAEQNINVGQDCGVVLSGVNDNHTENISFHDKDIDNDTNSAKTIYQSTENYFSLNKIEMQKLLSRTLRPCNSDGLKTIFEQIPELSQTTVVTILVPNQKYLPRNIFVNKMLYVIDFNEIAKNLKPQSTQAIPTYSSSDEESRSEIRRLRSSSTSENTQNIPLQNNFLPRFNTFFRPLRDYNAWRPRPNFNCYQFNMFYQRPFMHNNYFMPRYQFFMPRFPRANPSFLGRDPPHLINFAQNTSRDSSNNLRRNFRKSQHYHLQTLKNLAVKLKRLVSCGRVTDQEIRSLEKAISIYNSMFKCNIQLSPEFEIIDSEQIVETIEIDDEDQSQAKKRKFENNDTFDENLSRIKQIAMKIKVLITKGKASARHRRALSNTIKTFNKSYNADIYFNTNYDIINRRHIILDSSSEPESVVDEDKQNRRPKKVKNPFNILKRLSEKLNGIPCTSQHNEKQSDVNNEPIDNNNQNDLLKIFGKNWLPDSQDFGRAEVKSTNAMICPVIDIYQSEFLYDFLKNHDNEYDNWVKAKIAYLNCLEENRTAEEDLITYNSTIQNSTINSVIRLEDCSDMEAILEKLRIVQNIKESNVETNLKVIFDVYNRNVPNFKKSDKPTPHFRVVCVAASSDFPTLAEVISLHSKYKDDVDIVFAVVDMDSVKYIQMIPEDSPVYIPSNDLND